MSSFIVFFEYLQFPFFLVARDKWIRKKDVSCVDSVVFRVYFSFVLSVFAYFICSFPRLSYVGQGYVFIHVFVSPVFACSYIYLFLVSSHLFHVLSVVYLSSPSIYIPVIVRFLYVLSDIPRQRRKQTRAKQHLGKNNSQQAATFNGTEDEAEWD